MSAPSRHPRNVSDVSGYRSFVVAPDSLLSAEARATTRIDDPEESRHTRRARAGRDATDMRRVARSVAARALAGGFGTPSATPSGRLARASNPTSLAAGASRASPPIPAVGPRDVWIRRLSDLRGEAPAPPSLKPTPKEAFISALPGLGLAYGVAQGGFAVADHISARSGVTVSGVPCAIVLGAALNNAPFSIPGVFRPGIKLASSAVLKLGIVCVGAKLSVPEVLSAGALSVPVAFASVGAGLVVIPKLAAVAGLTPRLGSLLAAGTSICGVTAVSALAPAISATQAEVSVAVANVVVWGTLGMLALPHLARAAFGDVSEAAGAWLGVGVHDTAQVFGAGLTYQQRYGDERAFQVAAVTKLTRNALLAAAVPALVAKANATGKGRRRRLRGGGDVPWQSYARRRPRFSSRFSPRRRRGRWGTWRATLAG